MNKNFLILLCFLMIGVTARISLEAATLHAILVGDTNDDYLRKVIKKDLKHMENHLNTLFEFLNVDTYEQTIYTGRDTNSNLMADLERCEIQPDDIVFFYYSGHGFYGENTALGDWPTLYLSREDIGINQYDIMQALASHQPRLLICFTDCCNNILDEDDKPEIFDYHVKRYKGNPSMVASMQKLFFETKGVIMISSASPPYYAEGTDGEGSSFTNFYIKAFKKLIHSNQEKVTWDTILSDLQQELWIEQRPQYQLFLQ